MLKKSLNQLFPHILSLYRVVRFELKKNKKIYNTKWGFEFTGNEIMSKGNFEENETKLFRDLISESDLFINIGANIGYYVCHALSLNTKVIAFEPMQSNLHYLMKNLQINGFVDFELYPIALGKEKSISQIFGDGTGASLIKGWANIPENFFTYVPVNILDCFYKETFESSDLLILIDVEGAEYNTLLGASKFLDMKRAPKWIIEISFEELQPKNLGFNLNYLKTFDLFFSRGYKAYEIENNFKEITREEILQITKGDLKTRTNNFLFKK